MVLHYTAFHSEPHILNVVIAVQLLHSAIRESKELEILAAVKYSYLLTFTVIIIATLWGEPFLQHYAVK